MSAPMIAAFVMLVLIAIVLGFTGYMMYKQKKVSNAVVQKMSKEKTSSTSTMKKREEVIREDTRRLVKDIEDIEDGITTTDKGRRFVAAITCRGIDFYHGSAIEQHSVRQGYQQFINIVTEPITLRCYAKALDIDSLKDKYNNRYNEILVDYEMVERELESAQARNMEETALAQLRETKELLQQQLFHLSEQLGAMGYYSSTKVVLDRNQEYVFDWSYMPSASDVPLTPNEIFRKAKAELSAIAQRKIDALAASGVKARMCTTSEVVDACRRNSKPITSEIYKQKFVEASSWDEDIVTSASEEYFAERIKAETEDAIRSGVSVLFSEAVGDKELWGSMIGEDDVSASLFGSGKKKTGEEEHNCEASGEGEE